MTALTIRTARVSEPLRLGFKRLDLVKQLNGLAAGEYVLGEDGE